MKPLLLVYLLLACVPRPDCNTGKPSDNITVKFYKKKDSTALSVKFNIRARGTKHVFYNDKKASQSFRLKLNPTDSTATYLFQTANTNDTLVVKYQKTLKWVSQSCGPAYEYSNLKSVSSSFQAAIASSTVDYKVRENIKVYY